MRQYNFGIHLYQNNSVYQCCREYLKPSANFANILSKNVTDTTCKEIKNIYKCNYMPFFISNTFISNARLKLVKNQANAKQHPEAELLLFDSYSYSSSMLSSKNPKIIGHILRNKPRNKCVCIHETIRLIIRK